MRPKKVESDSPSDNSEAEGKVKVKKKEAKKRSTSAAQRPKAVILAASHAKVSSARAKVASTKGARTKDATVIKDADTSSAVCTSIRWIVGILLVLAVVLVPAANFQVGPIGGTAGVSEGQPAPCGCAGAAYKRAEPGGATQRLAASLHTRRPTAISGVHAHIVGSSLQSVLDALSFVKKCGVVERVDTALANVDELRRTLTRPLAKAKCVVWVVEESAISKVADALKELLEDNALRGTTVVPVGSRGMLVLASAKTREELKETLPHRVIHKFSTVKVTK